MSLQWIRDFKCFVMSLIDRPILPDISECGREGCLVCDPQPEPEVKLPAKKATKKTAKKVSKRGSNSKKV